MTKRSAAIACSALLASAVAASPPSIEERSISDLAAALRNGATSSHALVDAYQKRIKAVDRSGPTLRSVIALNPDALAQAIGPEITGSTNFDPAHTFCSAFT